MDSFNTPNSPLRENNNTYYAWAIGTIIVLVLIFAGYRMYTKNSTDGNGNGYDQGESVQDFTKATGDLEVENQVPGDIVYISSVTLSHPGFVTVSVTRGMDAGKIIGTKSFPEGKNPGQIVVSEKTKEGQTYTATLYADDGDGVLDTTKDKFLIKKDFRTTQYLEYIKG
ncbi:hypothetical protein EPO17_00335 [Patescibacteria group bacterium]|nr:MAG: hypothetical protein EPO17_00335 [Patescibacteria group bacterium]